LNVQIESVVGAEIAAEKQIELMNLARLREALTTLRHYAVMVFESPEFAKDTRHLKSEHYQVTLVGERVSCPMIMTFARDFDSRVTMGDLGECEVTVQSQPYTLPDGELINCLAKQAKKFTKGDLIHMSPMHWVNHALNARRRMVDVIYGKDLLDPSAEMNQLISHISAFLGTVTQGQAPSLSNVPVKSLAKYNMKDPGSFFLAVVLRGRVIFTIRI